MGVTLLKAIDRDPVLLIPQVVPLFIGSKHEFRDDKGFRKHEPEVVYTINPKDVKVVYDELNFRRHFVDTILKKYPGEDKWSDQDKDMVEQARKGFQMWRDEGLN